MHGCAAVRAARTAMRDMIRSHLHGEHADTADRGARLHGPVDLDVDLAFDFSKISVLIIDANHMCLDVLNGILAGFSFRRIHRTTELEGARKVVQTQGVDLVLIDPYPYGDDAYEFMRWFRTERGGLHASAPVLIVTGHTSMHLIKATLDCGADYVIAKPYSTNALLERILWVAHSDVRRGVHEAGDAVAPSLGSGVELS
jgi:CheY-like chemotaxis protein